jgi:hypothetical protein
MCLSKTSGNNKVGGVPFIEGSCIFQDDGVIMVIRVQAAMITREQTARSYAAVYVALDGYAVRRSRWRGQALLP